MILSNIGKNELTSVSAGVGILSIPRVEQHSFFFFFNLFYFILFYFLAVSGLSCSVRAPERVGSVVVARGLNCPMACGILVPRPGIKPASPALEGGFLTTGPPGKSLEQHSVIIF